MHLSLVASQARGLKDMNAIDVSIIDFDGKLAGRNDFIVSSGQFLMQSYPVRQ